MCIKIGDNEMDSVKSLMTMSLNALIAEVFDMGFDEIKPNLSLSNDLGMSAEKEHELSELIGEYFDDLSVDFSENDSLDELFQTIVNSEFDEITENNKFC